ncbi:MAG: ArsC family reductase [Pseudomonadota bacterium]
MLSKKSITVFGIPNCDTVKKARVWLQEQNVDFSFHDFKKDGLTRNTVENWLGHVDLNLLINRKGTTWRALTDEQKASCDNRDAAISLMMASPSVIKRPVLQIISGSTQQIAVGFSAQLYQPLFK